MKITFAMITFVFGVFILTGIAQTPTPGAAPTPRPKSAGEEAREESLRQKENADFMRNTNKRPDFSHKEESGPPGIPEIKGPTAIRPSAEQKLRLTPSPSDLSKYAGVLKRSNARLIKLFPDLGCVDLRILRLDGPCLDAIPFSSFYSFRKKNYADRWLSDIGLKEGMLFTDGLLSNGVIVLLGDIPFESVTTTTDGMQFLTEYKAASEVAEIVTKGKQMASGVTSQNHSYGWNARTLENMTYAIRVVAYRGRISKEVGEGYFYNQLGGDERVDIVAVFRVVRKDPDGNVTLLWRELLRKKSPKIKVSNEK